MTIRYVFRITDFPHFVGNGIAINLVVKKTGWVTVRGKVAVVGNRVIDWILAGWTVSEEIIANIFFEPVRLNQECQHDTGRFIIYFGCFGSTGSCGGTV